MCSRFYGKVSADYLRLIHLVIIGIVIVGKPLRARSSVLRAIRPSRCYFDELTRFVTSMAVSGPYSFTYLLTREVSG